MKHTSEEVFASIEARMGGVFRWGEEDCFLSAANVFLDLHGVDLAATVRGKYKSEDQAQRILSDFGGSLSVFMCVQAAARGLGRSNKLGEAPIGAIGFSPKECSVGLDGRCACIHLKPGIWVAKSIRGFVLSAEAEEFFYV